MLQLRPRVPVCHSYGPDQPHKSYLKANRLTNQIKLESRGPQSKATSQSEGRLFVSDSLQPHGLYGSWNSPGQNTGVGSCSLLQGIFPTQGLNPGFPHCRQILYQLATREALVEWNTSCHISGQEMSQSSVILGLPNVNEGSPKGMQCLLSRRFDAPYGDC